MENINVPYVTLNAAPVTIKVFLWEINSIPSILKMFHCDINTIINEGDNLPEQRYRIKNVQTKD